MSSPDLSGALDRARSKAYLRLLPLLFACYVIAYVDRVNVGFAKLNMQGDLADLGFSESVFGIGMGIFFVGYLLLEIPGTLLVEKWSARKWISRIMISWGIIAAMTAFVHYRVPWATDFADWVVGMSAAALDPLARADLGWVSRQTRWLVGELRGPGAAYVFQFWGVRFLLGLAEAGFYPGVIVYLTHWFPRRDRSRALAWFFIGTPIAQIISPPISEKLMAIGTGGKPPVLGLVGWQWVYIFWGIPAVVLGIIVLAMLTDWPHQARWLTQEERTALEAELAREKDEHRAGIGHMTVLQALSHPKILALAAAYFFVVTGNYGVELYMASILKDWYGLNVKEVAYLIIIPPIGSLIGQVFVGWNSDRTQERRWHASLPIVFGAIALALTPASRGTLWLTVALFTLAMTGLKAYLPAFWTLPSLLMAESAAAASIGLINSFGNLGGGLGPAVVGVVRDFTESYRAGLWFLAASMVVSACIIIGLGIGRKAIPGAHPAGPGEPLEGELSRAGQPSAIDA
jgi:ACS family tartrate transporter-like MFS transporter